jgi:hypothetical protein
MNAEEQAPDHHTLQASNAKQWSVATMALSMPHRVEFVIGI